MPETSLHISSTHHLFSSPRALGLNMAPIHSRGSLPFIRHNILAALIGQEIDAAPSLLESIPLNIFLEIAKHLLDDHKALMQLAQTSRRMLQHIMVSVADNGIPSKHYYPLLQCMFHTFANNYYIKLFGSSPDNFIQLKDRLALQIKDERTDLDRLGQITEQDLVDYQKSRSKQMRQYLLMLLCISIICFAIGVPLAFYVFSQGKDKEDDSSVIGAALASGLTLGISVLGVPSALIIRNQFFSNIMEKSDKKRVSVLIQRMHNNQAPDENTTLLQA